VKRWHAFALVGCAVLTAAVLDFFTYPLSAELDLLMVIVVPVAWFAATAAVLTGVLIIGRLHGGRSAVVFGLAAVLGFVGVAEANLEVGYPHGYFYAHRAEFAKAAAFADTIPVDPQGVGEATLPIAQRHLAGGRVSVGTSPAGRRAVVVWMSYASGIGYGYGYAPSSRGREVILSSPARMVAMASLGDGWWWVSSLGTRS
jgi:hypothetical protein